MTKVIVHPGICGFDTFLEAINYDGVVKLEIKTNKIFIDGIEVYYDINNEVYRPLGK